jgi:opacity protein-like surface antigen
MQKFLLSCAVLFLFLTASAVSTHAQIYQPEVPPFQFGVGYQYEHHDAFGRTFDDNGANEDIAFHVVDPLTSATWLIAGSLEARLSAGFGGQTTGIPQLSAKSLFVGAGPHFSLESRSRVVPWVHVLVGLQHYRFSQDGPIGSNNAFGFMGGGGFDIKVVPHIVWRIQGDYLGTVFQSDLQSGYSFGSGFMLNF